MRALALLYWRSGASADGADGRGRGHGYHGAVVGCRQAGARARPGGAGFAIIVSDGARHRHCASGVHPTAGASRPRLWLDGVATAVRWRRCAALLAGEAPAALSFPLSHCKPPAPRLLVLRGVDEVVVALSRAAAGAGHELAKPRAISAFDEHGRHHATLQPIRAAATAVMEKSS